MRSRFLALVAVSLLASCSAPPEDDVASTEEALKVCPGATTVKGIDVSHWDGTIDWAKVKSAGKDFAIMKVTEGTDYLDATFAANWSGTKSHGVVRGAYHFFHSNLDPIAQADWFLEKMGPLEPGDLPPTLDLEVTDGQSAATITSTTIKWLDHVAAKTGLKPILYTSPSFVTGSMGSPAGLENHATLWIANWGVTCPDVPTPFKTWSFWQYDDKGTVSGITSAVDLDEFDGTMKQLIALAKPSPTPPDAGVDTGVADTGTSSDGAIDETSSSDAADDTASAEDTGSDAGDDASPATSPASAEADATGGCACTTARGHGHDVETAWAAVAATVWIVARRRRSAC